MENVKENLLLAFRYLLKPLVRLAIKNGVVFPEFNQALKQAYVEVAAKQMKISGKDASEQGISLISNIQIADVRQILLAGSSGHSGHGAQEGNPLPTLLSAWHTDKNCTGPYGVLRDLAFSQREYEGSRPSDNSYTFSDLAAEYCPGLSARELLDELVRTKCVQDLGKGYYRATTRSYIPEPLSARSIFLFARIVHNICDAGEVNLRAESRGGKGLVERSIYTVHGISKKQLADFDVFIRGRAQIFADDIDNWLSDKDEEGRKESVRTGVGIYHYVVNDEDEQALSKELPH
jgi:hypothetical protein